LVDKGHFDVNAMAEPDDGKRSFLRNITNDFESKWKEMCQTNTVEHPDPKIGSYVIMYLNEIIRAGKAKDLWRRKIQHCKLRRLPSQQKNSKFYSDFWENDKWNELKWYEGLTYTVPGRV
jgi:hypothetical protein